jgi:hypothetical protein
MFNSLVEEVRHALGEDDRRDRGQRAQARANVKVAGPNRPEPGLSPREGKYLKSVGSSNLSDPKARKKHRVRTVMRNTGDLTPDKESGVRQLKKEIPSRIGGKVTTGGHITRMKELGRKPKLPR